MIRNIETEATCLSKHFLFDLKCVPFRLLFTSDLKAFKMNSAIFIKKDVRPNPLKVKHWLNRVRRKELPPYIPISLNFLTTFSILTDTGENGPKCQVNFRLGAESYSSLGRGGNSSGHFGTNSPVDKFPVLPCIG